MMKRLGLGALGAVFLAAAALQLPGLRVKPTAVGAVSWKSVGTTGVREGFQAPVRALTIEFGIRDNETTPWDGSVSLEGGQVVELRGHHFTPDQEIRGNSWVAGSTAWPPSRLVMHPGERPFPHATRAMTAGVTVYYRAPESARMRVETAQGNFSFLLSDLPAIEPLYFLEAALRVYRVPTVQQVSSESREDDYPSIAVDRDGTVSVSWIAYHDQEDEVWFRQYASGSWSLPVPVTERPGDLYGTSLAIDGTGAPVVAWSERAGNEWHLKARSFQNGSWGNMESITSTPGSHFFHRLVSDSQGRLHLVWQAALQGRFDIYYSRRANDAWSAPVRLSDPARQSNGNDWQPDLAVDSRGHAWVSWDSYDEGSYNVRLCRVVDGHPGQPMRVTNSPRFHARSSVAVDSEDRVWVAYELSGENWGKDTGFLFKGGTGLYQTRDIAVRVFDGVKWLEPRQSLAGSVLPGHRRYVQSPRLSVDSGGRVWVLFQSRTAANRSESDWGSGGKWELMVSFYDRDAWSDARILPESVSRNGSPFQLAAGTSGEVYAAWVTDQKAWGGGNFGFPPGDNQVVVGDLAEPLEGGPAGPASLGPAAGEAPTRLPTEPEEKEQVSAIRDYTIEAGGKTYRIYRGDLHRHTEISSDGAGDGTLLDSYRYMIDAAGMDFYMVSDHNSGDNHEYSWWRIEKSEDLFHLPGHFVTLFGYERSVNYPNGHRNIVYAERGHRTLPVTRAEAESSTGPILYPHLRETGGIAIPHSPATRMGTDWRDNDPDLEPVVEIFQGARNSGEYPGAPLAPSETREDLIAGGYREQGFVWEAWAKGYKLGVVASSDHVSTHSSYAMVVSSDFSRRGLLEAIRRRHTYGATSNIILDFRLRDSGRDYIHGDSFATDQAPLLVTHVAGTNAIKEAIVVRDNEIVYRRQGGGSVLDFTFMETDLQPGQHYYYVRVEQVDRHVAWSSPIWTLIE